MLVARYKIANRHYASLIGNAAAWGKEWDEMFDDVLYGFGATYSYDSVLGPISLTFSNSNFARKLSVILNVGYMF